jgi:flagellar basal body rod protein FlgC
MQKRACIGYYIRMIAYYPALFQRSGEKRGAMNIPAFDPGLSALQASAFALNSSAHNLANLDTPGFEARRVTFEEAAPSGVVARESATKQPVDIATEMIQQLKVRRLSEAAVASLKAGEELLGERLDRRG